MPTVLTPATGIKIWLGLLLGLDRLIPNNHPPPQKLETTLLALLSTLIYYKKYLLFASIIVTSLDVSSPTWDQDWASNWVKIPGHFVQDRCSEITQATPAPIQVISVYGIYTPISDFQFYLLFKIP